MLKACKYSILNMQPKKHWSSRKCLAIPLVLSLSLSLPVCPFPLVLCHKHNVMTTFEIWISKQKCSLIYSFAQSFIAIYFIACSEQQTHTHILVYTYKVIYGVHVHPHYGMVSDISSEIPCKHKSPSHIFWSGLSINAKAKDPEIVLIWISFSYAMSFRVDSWVRQLTATKQQQQEREQRGLRDFMIKA